MTDLQDALQSERREELNETPIVICNHTRGFGMCLNCIEKEWELAEGSE